MDPIRQAEKRYCSSALVAAITIGGVLMICGLTALGKGLIMGCLFSIVNFIALGGTIPLRMGSAGKTAFAIAAGSLGARMVLMALPMVIAIKTTEFHLVTTVIGLFLVQLSILADHLTAPVRTGFRKKLSGDI